MKQLKNFFNLNLFNALIIALLISFTACEQSNGQNSEDTSNPKSDPVQKVEKITINQENFTVDGKTLPSNEWAYKTFPLSDFADKNVTIDFSAKMKVTNKGDKTERLMWQIASQSLGYPVIAEHNFEAGTTDFVTVSGKNAEPIYLTGSEALYLSTYETNKSSLIIEVKDIKYTVSYTKPVETSTVKNWTSDDVPSIKDTYKDIFDSFGIACEYNQNELQNALTLKGLVKHANSITTGNEFKPDFIFNWGLNSSTPTEKFTASNGLTIDVPKSLGGFSRVDSILKTCKDNGLVMRGHVLVWHSQTPDNFFAKNYNASINGELISNIVDKDTMTARQEWYIKTVLEHVAKWEADNNDGNHIIWAWDVVNEAVADDANSSNWLRGTTSGTKNKQPGNSGSRWTQVYGNDEFIVNAFRFANAYAPEDVKLCYNDYNEYMGYKVTGICNLISDVQNGESQKINGKMVKPRIDVMGMQSHMGTESPSVYDYENAIKTYLNKGLDIHVTELDFAAHTSAQSKNCYSSFLKLMKKYGKEYSGEHKITNVTVWGINNKNSWIYNKFPWGKDGQENYRNLYPLLFDAGYTTESFWAVIDAAK